MNFFDRQNLPILKRMLISLGILLIMYYTFVLHPKSEIRTALRVPQGAFEERYARLAQNRASLLELFRLDPKNPLFDRESARFIFLLLKTNEKANQFVATPIPLHIVFWLPNAHVRFVNHDLPKAAADLQKREKDFWIAQAKFLDALQHKDSKEQREFLASPESIKLLTEETNLLLAYQFWLEKIRQYQKD